MKLSRAISRSVVIVAATSPTFVAMAKELRGDAAAPLTAEENRPSSTNRLLANKAVDACNDIDDDKEQHLCVDYFGYACPDGPQDVCVDLVEEIYDEFEKEQAWPTWADAIADLAPASSNTDFSGGICYGIGDKKRRETCYLFYLSGCAVDQLNPSCADLVEDVIKIRQKKELFESGGFPSVISDHPCYALVESNKQEDMCLEYQEEDCASDDTTKDCQDVLKDVEKEYGRGVVPEWMKAFRPKLPVTDENFFDLIFSYYCNRKADSSKYSYDNKVVPVFGEIQDWDVSEVTSMRSAFNLQSKLFVCGRLGSQSDYRLFNPQFVNHPVSDWDVSSVKDMTEMFQGCSGLTQDLSSWDVSSVLSMEGMFRSANAFNQDISSWDVSSVTNMNRMFYGAKIFNRDIASWDVSSVTNMGFMFNNADGFNHDISSWNVSSVQNFAFMFEFTESFNQDISGWNVRSGTDFEGMFQFAEAFNQNLCAWGVDMIANDPEVEDMFGDTICDAGDDLDPEKTEDAAFPYSPMCHECVVACTDCQAKSF